MVYVERSLLCDYVILYVILPLVIIQHMCMQFRETLKLISVFLGQSYAVRTQLHRRNIN